jgi:hypothetical protein
MEAQLSPPSTTMPNLAVGYFVCVAITSSAVSVVAVVADVWKLTSFLILGALLGVVWACLSKSAKEEGRMTKARVLVGLLSGVCVPRVVEWCFPRIRLDALDPLLIIAISFLLAVCGFFIVHTALRGVEKDQKKTGGMLYSVVKKKIASDAGNPGESEEKTDEEKNNTDAGNTS